MECCFWEHHSAEIIKVIEKLDIEKIEKKVNEFLKWYISKPAVELIMEENQSYIEAGETLDDLLTYYYLYMASDDDFCRYERGMEVVKYYRKFIKSGYEMKITKEG